VCKKKPFLWWKADVESDWIDEWCTLDDLKDYASTAPVVSIAKYVRLLKELVHVKVSEEERVFITEKGQEGLEGIEGIEGLEGREEGGTTSSIYDSRSSTTTSSTPSTQADRLRVNPYLFNNDDALLQAAIELSLKESLQRKANEEKAEKDEKKEEKAEKDEKDDKDKDEGEQKK